MPPGIDTVVIDAVPSLRPLGVGINLMPHALPLAAGLHPPRRAADDTAHRGSGPGWGPAPRSSRSPIPLPCRGAGTGSRLGRRLGQQRFSFDFAELRQVSGLEKPDEAFEAMARLDHPDAKAACMVPWRAHSAACAVHDTDRAARREQPGF
jgi:hypothetical protein